MSDNVEFMAAEPVWTNRTTPVPDSVDRALGDPETVAYFLDHDTGHIIIADAAEVTLR